MFELRSGRVAVPLLSMLAVTSKRLLSKGTPMPKKLCLLAAFALGFSVTAVQAQRPWQDADLTALTGGPLVGGEVIAMAYDPVSNAFRTHYIAGDGHVHELSLVGGRWQDADLTAITGETNASGHAIAIAFDPIWNGMRTHYRGVDGHMHELFLSGIRWQGADLTAITGGPNLYGCQITMAFDPVWNGMRTHYVAADGHVHVHELFLSGGRWQEADLTALAGAPVSGQSMGGALAMVFDSGPNGMRTHYGAGDGDVHELFLNGSRWQDADLTAITGGSTPFAWQLAIAFDPASNTMRTHYNSANRQDRHVHELFLSGGRWQSADLTALAGGPDIYDLGSVAMAFDSGWNVMRTLYIARDLHVHQLSLSAGLRWQDADLTAAAGGPIAASRRLAMRFDSNWNGGMRAHYVAGNGHMHELFLPAPPPADPSENIANPDTEWPSSDE